MKKVILFFMIFLSFACSKEELPVETQTDLLEHRLKKMIHDNHVKEITVLDHFVVDYFNLYYTHDFEVKSGMLRVGRIWYNLSIIKETELIPNDPFPRLKIRLNLNHRY
ncbi:hypothetical protein K5X82_14305 [Halosquirtibacter xylanolyticus]|uniref:hypothetical protein n=1 Tax=Halosquirtibacter xylanolyticus TaxID=3374599 RepID=UPI003748F32D|nr:hypothetical protein K5X82_14305 [Prolixibacteraceae bacterium]